MKTIWRKMLLACCITAIPALAATQLWTFGPVLAVYQVVADGSGGCAVGWIETNGFMFVTWLDKKGNEVFSHRGSGFSPGGPVLGCNKKQLVYADVPGLFTTVTVDRKGVATVVTALGAFLQEPPGSPSSRCKLDDPRGIFLVNMNTNTGFQTLIRMSHK